MAGMLTAPPPLVNEAFVIPFSVLYQERWFVQYPPGRRRCWRSACWAHPGWCSRLLGAGAVVLIVLTARRQYGLRTDMLVLGLLVTSPFLLLSSGAFLGHVPALFASVAFYAGVRYAERAGARLGGARRDGPRGSARPARSSSRTAWSSRRSAWCGAVRCGPAIVLDVLVVAVIFGASVGLYLGYNAAVTGDPFLLPRHSSTARMCWDSGRGSASMGSTVASGLVNVEQQLVSLGFSLAGWPFGFALAVMLLPFLRRGWDAWDSAYLALMALFVAIYVAEFYHGIAFGPRYLFEALPAFVILTARGLIVLAHRVGGWLAAARAAVARAPGDGADRRGAAGLQRALLPATPGGALRRLHRPAGEDRPWTRR